MSLIKTREINPRYHRFFQGYISEDAGSLSGDVTEVAVTEVLTTEPESDEFNPLITYVSATKKFTLDVNTVFNVTVQTEQTGSGATLEIYDLTEDEVLRITPAAAGAKTLIHTILTANVVKDIQIRVDDQDANGSTATTGIVRIEAVGRNVV